MSAKVVRLYDGFNNPAQRWVFLRHFCCLLTVRGANFSMNLIVDLPTVLQSSILGEWLDDPEEICFLDSAYCNKRLRPGFLQTLETSYTIPAACTSETDVNEWLIARKVKANEVTINSDAVGDEIFLEGFLGTIGLDAVAISFVKDDEEEPNLYSTPKPLAISNIVWPIILKHCMKLRILHCVQTKVDASIADFISATKLERINFENARDLTTDVLRACCAAPNLYSLSLEKASFVKDSPDLVDLPLSPSMRTLLATGCKLSNATALSLLSAFPNLTELSLLGARGGLDLQVIAEHTPNLLKCTLSHITNVLKGPAATSLCSHWQKIKFLALLNQVSTISACTDEALFIFIESLPELQWLRLACSKLNRDTHHHITHQFDFPSGCTGSRLVNLQCAEMKTASLEQLCATCPHLSVLHLVSSLHPWWSYPPIAPFHLLHNTAVDALILEGLTLSNENLRSIHDMKYLYFINVGGTLDRRGFQDVARQCPNLIKLTVSGSARFVNYDLMRALLDGCPKLKSFMLTSLDSETVDTPAHHALNQLVRRHHPYIDNVDISL